MSSQKQPPDQSLNSLQILRGVAASVVAFYHSYLITAQPDYIGVPVFEHLNSRGWLGVNLFFVLSGFIILLAHSRDIGSPKSIPTYAIKRLIRIYPIYWVFLTLFIGAAAVGIGHPDFEWKATNLLSSYALIKFTDPVTLPLKVAWTLFYEVTFYAMFITFLINLRLGIIVFALWALSILVAVFGFDYRELSPLNAWNLYFPIGMISYLAYTRLPFKAGLPVFIVGCLSFVAIASTYLGARETFMANDPMSALAFVFPCAFIIVGAALSERHYRWVTPRPLLLLGEASYSVYLVHSAIISLFAILYAKLHLTFMPATLFFFLAAISSIVAGVIMHKLLEVPLLKLLRNVLLGKKRRPQETAGGKDVVEGGTLKRL